MYTKVQAAGISRQAGIEVIIVAGQFTDVIRKIMNYEPFGTKLIPLEASLERSSRQEELPLPLTIPNTFGLLTKSIS